MSPRAWFYGIVFGMLSWAVLIVVGLGVVAAVRWAYTLWDIAR
jgi:hypothetical protein